MQIAVYSGSFDPLHEGHLAILSHLEKAYDKVLLVVSPQNPFKGNEKAMNANPRLENVREAIARHRELKKVEVSDIEFNLSAPQYTCRTLDVLQKMYPSDSLTLIMGADNLNCLSRWRNYSEILLEYGVDVFPRRGYDMAADRDALLRENPLYRIHLSDMPLVDISSTQIREAARLEMQENPDKSSSITNLF